MFNKIKSISLAIKIPVAAIIIVLVTALIVTLISYNSAKEEVTLQVKNKLSAILDGRSSELSAYLEVIQEDLLLVSTNPNTISALNQFTQDWQTIGTNASDTLRKLYVTSQLSDLYDARDGSDYSVSHATLHSWFHELQKKREYYDIFLFNVEGDLVYSVFKEADFGTNMNSGQWKTTDLANTFKASINASAGDIAFFDFKPYAPSADAPASFISTPVFDESGARIGVVAFQMPIARINTIMQKSAGMGETGESYIVGKDFLMRSDSRFLKDGETSILKTKVDGETVKAALNNQSGLEVINDYRDISVYSAYQGLSFNGVNWALLSEIDEEEVNEPIIEMRNMMIMIASGLVVLLGGAAYFAAGTITKPIEETVKVMGILSSEGRTDISVPYQNRQDELGKIGRAVETFRQSMIDGERLRAEAKRAEEAERERLDREKAAEDESLKLKADQERAQAAEVERKAKAMAELIEKFNSEVTNMIQSVSSGATELEVTAQTMTSTAESAGLRSATVAAAAEQASTNVQTVASAAEEMSASVNEISQQMERSNVATQAVEAKAKSTTSIMNDLTASSQSINEIIQLINDIAEQTNLLALNATIEAARAGDAGKGFAVVASEVKSLAGQTANATSQIGAQIQDIQNKVKDAAVAMDEISSSIEITASMASSVASAVEEQQAVTNEISRNVQEAARGTQDVSENITGVASGAAETAAAASQVMLTSKDIAEQTVGLKTTIDTFLNNVSKVA
jgi:methyl-accepting chemotaxis protein